jgi:hypothetical protein
MKLTEWWIVEHVLTGWLSGCCRQQCFAEVSGRRAADLMSSYATIKTVLHQLYDGLHEIVLKLLRTADTRESMLQYLAEVVQKNASRSQLQVTHLQQAIWFFDHEELIGCQGGILAVWRPEKLSNVLILLCVCVFSPTHLQLQAVECLSA